MKKWEKEIVAKQIKDEQTVIYRLRDSFHFAMQDVQEKIQILQGREQTQSVIYQLKYQKELQRQLEEIYSKMSMHWYSDIDSYLNGCYEDSFFGTMYQLHQEGIPVVIPFNQEEMAQMAAQSDYTGIHLSENLYDNSVEMARIARQEMTRGIATNDSWAAIARRIEQRGEANLNQAIRIVRTESHRINNEVKMKTIEQAKGEGADVVKQWDSTVDGRTRMTHIELDGQLRETDQPFKIPSSGYTAMYPGGFHIPGEDINCRCQMLQRARWALDKSEIEKCVGDLSNASDEQMQAWADKLGVSKEDLIAASNGIIEADGTINHAIQAKNYNEFKKKYQKKAAQKAAQQAAQAQVVQEVQTIEDQIAALKAKQNALLNGKDFDTQDIDVQLEWMQIEDQIHDLTAQTGVADWETLKNGAVRFNNGWDADKYHKDKNFVQSRWDNDLSANEREGIRTYTSNFYGQMNSTLRTDSYSKQPKNSKVVKAIDNCTSGLEKCLLAEDTVVFRGMGGADALSAWTGIPLQNLSDPAVQQALVGSRLVEKAFMSTGTNMGSAWSGIKLEVYLPKGTQAMYVDPISVFHGEYEILVQRNSTFEVMEVQTESNGYIKGLVLRLVEQNH